MTRIRSRIKFIPGQSRFNHLFARLYIKWRGDDEKTSCKSEEENVTTGGSREEKQKSVI